jgi:hypothetical protein
MGHIGTGLPEEAVEGLIDMILGREKPRPADDLLKSCSEQ